MGDKKRSAYLLGIIGWPVSHSKSPAMHHAAATDLNIDLVYLRLPVLPVHLPEAIRGLPALGFRGVNVTVPHKEAVIPFMDEVDTAATVIGAVNTIVIESNSGSHGRMTGYNSDWSGFLADLREKDIDVTSRQCFILGAGGSARAIAYALATSGGQVTLFARRKEQAQRIVDHLAEHTPHASIQARDWTSIAGSLKNSPTDPLIVNCTPVGMAPEVGASPWPGDVRIPTGAFIYDLVYSPAETKFMQQGQAAGCQVTNGLGMLVHQGAQAFRLWTGLDPNIQQMAAVLD